MPFFVLRHWRGLGLIFILGIVFFVCKDAVFPVIKNSGEIINNQQHQKVWEATFRATSLVRDFRSSEMDKVFFGETLEGRKKEKK